MKPQRYIVQMTDAQIIEFANKYRASGNIKYDLLRHKVLLLESYLNPCSKNRRDRPMIKEWIRRLQRIVENNPNLWLNDNTSSVSVDLNNGKTVTTYSAFINRGNGPEEVVLYTKES